MSFTSPAPGGTETRTDQGVDWSNIRGNIVAVASGTITTIYHGLQGFGTTIIERIGPGTYGTIYYAEETGGGTPVVHAGQRVAQGQALAPGLGSGGIEVGFWNPSTGRALAAPGFVDRPGNDPTPAGSKFRSMIGTRNRSAGVAGPTSSLAQLWIEAGGSPKLANIMAAIAMAESGGNPSIVGGPNTDGTYDRGLWQINDVNHYNHQKLVSDPLYNARAAVAIEKSSGLQAWVTYQTGAYKQFLGKPDLIKGGYGGGGSTFGGTRPGGQPANQPPPSQVPQIFQNYLSLRDMPRTAPPSTKNPFAWLMSSFTGNWSNMGLPNE